MATGPEILEQAKTYIDTRWKHQGRSPGIALDCIGVYAMALLETGTVDYIPPPNYPINPDGTFLPKFRESGLVEITRSVIQAGDCIVFSHSSTPCHCGVYDPDGHRVVHAHRGHRKVTRELIEDAKDTLGFPTNFFRCPSQEDF